MKNYLCWDLNETYKVINTEVDEIDDSVFRAIHTDTKIQVETTESKNITTKTLDDFIPDFLESNKQISLVPVLGESGTGKSHLIRWLKMNIPPTSRREVIFIPKTQNSLRSILVLLIEKLPKPKQKSYLEVLKKTEGTTLKNHDVKCQFLLNKINEAITNDSAREEEKDLENFNLKGLKNLFIDPYFRENENSFFLNQEHILNSLVSHVFDEPSTDQEYQGAEKRRNWEINDLPLNIKDLHKAASSTRIYLKHLLGDKDAQKNAIKIINRNLDSAIAECFNMSTDKLNSLFLEIRCEMKKLKKSLVFLIEDFARMQGIDRGLCDAIIVKGNEEYCPLYTAFACTTGYYEGYEKTFKTRATDKINMDLPFDDEEHSMKINSFVAKYMNALRLGKEKLDKEWKSTQDKEDKFSVSNFCEDCKHKDVCHKTFGEADGFGLYPYTETAIKILARRADKEIISNNRFRPREFIRNVMLKIASDGDSIPKGKFPTEDLFNSLGGLRDFEITEQNKLRRLPNWQNRLALIILWGGVDKAVNINRDVQDAFGFTYVEDFGPPIDDGDSNGDKKEGTEQPETQDNPRLKEITQWLNKEIELGSNIAQELRKGIHDALKTFIDFDEMGVSRKSIMGTNKFQPGGIYFKHQTTQPPPKIIIEIPNNWDDVEEKGSLEKALKGFLKSRKNKKWETSDISHWHELLENCARQLKEQVEIDNSEDTWSPLSTAIQLKLLGNKLFKSKEELKSKYHLIQSVFQKTQNESGHFLNNELEEIVDLITEDDNLTDYINERTSAQKNGQAGSWINAIEIQNAIDVLEENDHKLKSIEVNESGTVKEVENIQNLAMKIEHKNLREGIDEEIKKRKKWLADIELSYGQDKNQADIGTAALNLTSALSGYGMDITGAADLQRRSFQFEGVFFDDCVKKIKASDNNASQDPTGLGISKLKETYKAYSDLTESFMGVISTAESEIHNRLKTAGIKPDEVQGFQNKIIEELDMINQIIEDGQNDNLN